MRPIANVASLVDESESSPSLSIPSSSNSSLDSPNNNEAELLKHFNQTVIQKKNATKRLSSNFWKHSPVIDTSAQQTFPLKSLKNIFIKYNTVLPSSAAVEWLCFLGKDVLMPKCSSLTDQHFETSVF